ncbi:hypothetical protein GCK72_019529 [Caenorhabditis remanei]|uniref:F-box domain-containing protein n=1 Tax=Caenorhabditis remanei TaxID=31234 RepID=A0A6A5GE10_CAERE|nr:hypothetical protein GCK72_019529 [Caenorhabditis remanei]KAF1752974.1 hypothetical protein GCK72_019529 [Caenorhabditis remanei]
MYAEPTWQGIPSRIKQDIVTSLDYRSRFRLRVCLKSDQYLVDNSPIILEGLKILWRPSGFALAVKKDGKVSEIHDNSTEKLINLFFDVFKVKRSNQYELSQLFSTLAADLVFVVTLEFKKLQGYVCNRRTINEDFEEFSKWDNAPFAFLRSNPSN